MARMDGGSALAFCVLHDLLGAAAFLAAHPLHAAYALFFHRGLLALAAFFCPLLLSTALLLVVLLTAAPYAAPGWAGARCLGSTCGVAVAALCAGLRPDGRLGLVGQLCSFVLGPAGVGEVVFVGEVCDVGGGSCFLLEEKSSLYAYAAQEMEVDPPLQSVSGEEICFLGNGEFYEEDIFSFKDEIQEKNVVCEDLKKAPESLSSSSEHCCRGETFMPVPEMEEQEKSINKVQSVSLPERKGFSGDDAVEEKRLECDPVPLSAMEAKKPERVSKPHSSISQRIRQWESGNLKLVLDEIEDNPVEICFENESFKVVDLEEPMQLETESWDQKQSEEQLAQEESDRKQLPEEELVDVKEELVQSKVAEECIIDLQQAEEIASIIGEQRSEDVKAQEDAQPDGQDHQEDVQQPASEPQEEQEHTEDADGGEGPLRSTSIARRVHTRTSSESLAGAGEGSPSKGKEWKRTLACKLYEERIQHKLCRGRAVAGACADDMDMLWEAYETGGGTSSAAAVAVAGDTKLRGGGGSKAAQESVDEEEEEDEEEGPVRQLCCLQALKFSTRKMNLGGGKPSLSKISRVLRRMTALSRVGSRRK
ncbi:hypothetical protein CFC21_021118 [Triticum aestivum]|uniref:Uncharacterized protein n=3 Tax=Triticum TaxID=4564 RepID=A0A9R1PCN6_TRITD|nr:uncharacterized protein LOC123043317 [Triticum aestivum]KAF7006045.1 hypothetical protein CFC21_021118 [Triticum aestivum]VAH40885.1 unnamed protein product [Triticum turgidum subsp. durum]